MTYKQYYSIVYIYSVYTSGYIITCCFIFKYDVIRYLSHVRYRNNIFKEMKICQQ